MLNEHINRFLGVLCYPMLSYSLLQDDLLEKYLQKGSTTIKDKELLRQDLVDYMRQNYSIRSYDELYLYLDKCYLYKHYSNKATCKNTNNTKQNKSFDYVFEHLKGLSKCFISQRDGKVVYKYWESEDDKNVLSGFADKDKICFFHSLNRHIPLDILVILFMVLNGKKRYELDGFFGNINVSDALLDQVLVKGVAENHLHSGVGTSFLQNWDNWMLPLTHKKVKLLATFTLENKEGKQGNEIKFNIWFAALLRTSILVILKDEKRQNKDDIFKSKDDVKNDLIKYIVSYCSKRNGIEQLFLMLMNEEVAIEDFFMDAWETVLEDHYNDQFVCTLTDLVPGKIHTLDENLFLYEVISTICNKKSYRIEVLNDIKILFLTYLRIKNYMYSLNVQQKTTHGLDYFQQQYYKNNARMNKTARALSNYTKWECVIREQLQNTHLLKLELRTSISSNEAKFKKEIQAFLRAYRDVLATSFCKKIYINGTERLQVIRPFPKLGLVFHLLKEEQDYYPEKCVGQVSEGIEYLQFGKLYEQYKKKIENLKSLREEVILLDHNKGFYLDKYLVGLDVASLENTVPTWVFVHIYAYARDSYMEPLCYVDRQRTSFQGLGFTYHVGEDFRHLLSGLRRIDEVVSYLKFRAGDRIGHGIALGIEPEEWYKESPTVVMTRVEALENYLWAYTICSRIQTEQDVESCAYLEIQINRLAQAIYGKNDRYCNRHTKGLTTEVLIEGYTKLFKENVFEKYSTCKCEGCKEGKHKESLCKAERDQNGGWETFIWDAEALVIAKHCKNFLYAMNEPIHMRVTKQDIILSTRLQQVIKQNISQQGVIVEVNPSSNVAIGPMDTLKQHQIYSINNFHLEMDNIITCINSDDPSVFNTNVSNELAYIYWVMLEKGVSRETVLQWIDKLRENGMNASFIRRTETDEQLFSELNELVESF